MTALKKHIDNACCMHYISEKLFMKQFIVVLVAVIALPLCLHAQAQPYKVVFDLTSKDTAIHGRVMRWIDLITKSNPSADLEVVFYGQSLEMVTKGKSAVEEQVAKFAATKNVHFAVCEHAMKVFNVSKDMLIPGVTTVPDGIYEIVTKEAAGYGYIKVSP
jgi:intracellular sulfur oxidation DsrE/DsrF family protein